MDLSEFITGAKPPWHVCPVQWAKEACTPEQVEKVEAALRHPEVRATAIADVLTKWTGRKVAQQAMRRHRRGECACG